MIINQAHCPHSLRFRPDLFALAPEPRPSVNLQPLSDLDLMIANGWGDTPQLKLPTDWRERHK